MSDPDHGGALFADRKTVFATTHWSVVLQAGETASAQGTAALEKLCRTYWYPLYAFIRRKGHAEADAQDLTQEFFARLLAGNTFQMADARKGKFRTFLLAALGHFLSNARDYAQAAKRGAGQTIISLDAITAEQLHRLESTSNLSPDKLFDQRWAMTLLEAAVVQLQEEMAAPGKGGQFEALKPFLTNDPSDGEYAIIGRRIGSPGQSVAVTVHRMRQRYRELVRAAVAHTVSSPSEVEEEMRHLFAALNS